MPIDLNNFLNQVLEIINYQEDKEVFINTFLQNAEKETILNLIQSLPQDKQNEISQKLKEINNPSEIKQVVETFFNPDILKSSFEQTAIESLEQYLALILPNLSEDQKQKLVDLIDSIQENEF